MLQRPIRARFEEVIEQIGRADGGCSGLASRGLLTFEPDSPAGHDGANCLMMADQRADFVTDLRVVVQEEHRRRSCPLESDVSRMADRSARCRELRSGEPLWNLVVGDVVLLDNDYIDNNFRCMLQSPD